MEYDESVFTQQFPLVKRFVYHLAYYRLLIAAYNRFQLRCEFWTHTIDAHILQAAIQWCKVFGSEGCNPTHWKMLSKGESKAFQQSFRQGLLTETDFSSLQEWKQYWSAVNAFRNRYAAHSELEFREPVPDFGPALQVSFFYDRWVRRVISPDSFAEPPLEETAEALKFTVRPLICQLIKLTGDYEPPG